jgi:hypothetical protein
LNHFPSFSVLLHSVPYRLSMRSVKPRLHQREYQSSTSQHNKIKVKWLISIECWSLRFWLWWGNSRWWLLTQLQIYEHRVDGKRLLIASQQTSLTSCTKLHNFERHYSRESLLG